MIGWIIGIGVLGVGGYLAYKAISGASSSPLGSVENIAKSGLSSAESLLSKDPISVTNVGKDLKTGASTVYDAGKGVVNDIEGWF
jgi:hypothetical protein